MISKILDWCINNRTLLINLIELIILIIIILVKRKVKIVDSNLVSLFKVLPEFINHAESFFIGEKSGLDKFNFVYQSAINFISNLSDLSVTEVQERYGSIISSSIENILSTPTKKGN